MFTPRKQNKEAKNGYDPSQLNTLIKGWYHLTPYRQLRSSFGFDYPKSASENAKRARLYWSRLQKKLKPEDGIKEQLRAAKAELFKTLVKLKFVLLHGTHNPIQGDALLSRDQAAKNNTTLPVEHGDNSRDGDAKFVFFYLRPEGFPHPELSTHRSMWIYEFDLQVALDCGYEIAVKRFDRTSFYEESIRDGHLFGNIHYVQKPGPLQPKAKDDKDEFQIAPAHPRVLQSIVTTATDAKGNVFSNRYTEDRYLFRGGEIQLGCALMVLESIEEIESVDALSAWAMLEKFIQADKQKRNEIAADLFTKLCHCEATVANKISLHDEMNNQSILAKITTFFIKESAEEKALYHRYHPGTKIELVELPPLVATTVFANDRAIYRDNPLLNYIMGDSDHEAKLKKIAESSALEVNQKIDREGSGAGYFFGTAVLESVCSKFARQGRFDDLTLIKALIQQGANFHAVKPHPHLTGPCAANALNILTQDINAVFYLITKGSRDFDGLPNDIVFEEHLSEYKEEKWTTIHEVILNECGISNELDLLLEDYFFGKLRNHISAQKVNSKICFNKNRVRLIRDQNFPNEPLIELIFKHWHHWIIDSSDTTDSQLIQEIEELLENDLSTLGQLKRLLSLTQQQYFFLTEFYCYCKHMKDNIRFFHRFLYIMEHFEKLIPPAVEALELLNQLADLMTEQSKESLFDYKQGVLTFLKYRVEHPQQEELIPYWLGDRTVANWDAFQINHRMHFPTLEVALNGFPQLIRNRQIHSAYGSPMEVLERLLVREFITVMVCIQNCQYFLKNRKLHPITGDGPTDSANLLNDSFRDLFDIECKVGDNQIDFNCKKIPEDILPENLSLELARLLKLDPNTITLHDGKIIQIHLSVKDFLSHHHRTNYLGAIVLNTTGAIALALDQKGGYVSPGGHNAFPYFPILGVLLELEKEASFVPSASFDLSRIQQIYFDDHVMAIFPPDQVVLTDVAKRYCDRTNRPFMADPEEFSQGSETFLTPREIGLLDLSLKDILSLEVYLSNQQTVINQQLQQLYGNTFLTVEIENTCQSIKGYRYPDERFGIIRLLGPHDLLTSILNDCVKTLPYSTEPVWIVRNEGYIDLLNISPYLLSESLRKLIQKDELKTHEEKTRDIQTELLTLNQQRALFSQGKQRAEVILQSFPREFLCTLSDESINNIAEFWTDFKSLALPKNLMLNDENLAFIFSFLSGVPHTTYQPENELLPLLPKLFQLLMRRNDLNDWTPHIFSDYYALCPPAYKDAWLQYGHQSGWYTKILREENELSLFFTEIFPHLKKDIATDLINYAQFQLSDRQYRNIVIFQNIWEMRFHPNVHAVSFKFFKEQRKKTKIGRLDQSQLEILSREDFLKYPAYISNP